MTINVLIGVGGTGAKTVEAALVLLAAGGLEGTVHVGLVDQDGANGNVTRTKGLLNRLHSFRDIFSRTNAEHYVSWPSPEIPGLGAVDVRPLFNKPEPDALWQPNSAGTSLREMMGRNLPEPHQHLFDMLFMSGDEEQDLQLDEGYRGRAHVGSAALVASLAQEENRFITRLHELMDDPAGQHVNIFLVGSAFGGTGAAGFPTLARKLHRMRSGDAKEPIANRDNVMIGGLLMLPYFNFDKPEVAEKAVVSANELLPKAQLALEYYDSLFEHEQSFDRFYVMGWNEQFPLGYHEPGAREQTNPALPPEFVSASSAIDFFRESQSEEREQGVRRFASGRHARAVRWRDVSDGTYQAALGQLLRFCAYWHYIFEPELQKPKKLLKSNWAHNLAGGAKANEAVAELHALRQVTEAILYWAATVEAMGGERHWGAGPWSVKGLLDAGHQATPISPVRLRPMAREEDALAAFNGMIRDDNGDSLDRGAAAVYEELAKPSDSSSGHNGLGKAVAAVYQACRIK